MQHGEFCTETHSKHSGTTRGQAEFQDDVERTYCHLCSQLEVSRSDCQEKTAYRCLDSGWSQPRGTASAGTVCGLVPPKRGP